jgi:hypothetical protein
MFQHQDYKSWLQCIPKQEVLQGPLAQLDPSQDIHHGLVDLSRRAPLSQMAHETWTKAY